MKFCDEKKLFWKSIPELLSNLDPIHLFSLFLVLCVPLIDYWHDKVEQLDEDSSYDSDTEAINSPHPNVSRNVSETLGQELEDYNNSVSIFHYFFFLYSIPSSAQNNRICFSFKMLNCCCFYFFFSTHFIIVCACFIIFYIYIYI